jgi:diguanylate cyclase (GGDEF)-like protein/PAS domain S-box-containing protein
MGVDFTPQESLALYELLAQDGPDIILKTDRHGFIRHASQPAARRNGAFAGDPAGHHLLDLVHPASAAPVRDKLRAVLAGRADDGWTDFRAQAADDGHAHPAERWFAIRLRGLAAADGAIYGTIAVMRSIEERRSLEERLFEATMTDPLTGLTNRRAFIAMLQHLVDRRTGGCLAIFSVDYFRAMNMRHGQAFGDEVLVVFARLLRTLMRPEHIVSRIGDESLAVLLPLASPRAAEALCGRVVATLTEIRRRVGADGEPITASVGIAAIGDSLDRTINRAELALFLAKAKGRNRVETDRGQAPGHAPGATPGQTPGQTLAQTSARRASRAQRPRRLAG